MNSEREGNRGGNIEKGESEIKEEERETGLERENERSTKKEERFRCERWKLSEELGEMVKEERVKW